MKKLITLIVALSAYTMVHAEPTWELKKDKDGIKVYTGHVPDANVQAVRVICTVDANLSQLAALLLDTKAHTKWVYNTTNSYTVKQISDNHVVYYSEVSLAWPFSNRDVVIDMNVWQPAGGKTMYVTANTIANYVPAKDGIVRVPMSKSTWVITPIGNNQLNIDYIAQADPGGSVPDWIVNTFCTKGPFETFKSLKELVTTPAYKKAQYAFVKD